MAKRQISQREGSKDAKKDTAFNAKDAKDAKKVEAFNAKGGKDAKDS